MCRDKFILKFAALFVSTIFSSGFMPVSAVPLPAPIHKVQTTPQSAAPAAIPETPSPPVVPPEPPRPLTVEELKAVNDRLVFDRALVDASVLLTNLENFRRGKSKTPVSLSAFRSLEIRLNEIADTDPANTQARDLAKTMQMAQFQILQPSVAVAAAADRQLYAGAMSEKMQDDGIAVTVSGRDARVVRFASPRMTREMGKQLLDSAKIAEQSRQLQFNTVIFTNGRRSWRYEPDRNRYR